MKRRAAGVSALLLVLWNCVVPPPDAETVVLVHGLGRTSSSLALLSAGLQASGFEVFSVDYASRRLPLEDLVDSLAASVAECCADRSESLHFVTHSMGGILVRAYLAMHPDYSGRVVMLSPPNRGSEIIDALGPSALLTSIVGPAGVRLGTDSTSFLRELGPVRFPLGIITGDRSFNPLASWLIPGPDDGTVSVDGARIEGASDFLVVPATHTFIMNRGDVAQATIRFLRTGTFD